LERQTILSLQNKKKQQQPIVALTCYDAASAILVDDIGADFALVGDSLANTRLGYRDTIPVTLDEMLHHTRAASRGISRALLVADMPFHSYEAAPWEAAVAAGRFLKEAHAQAVKVEGGARVIDSIKAILKANVPVMGHLGLTPQSVNQMSGYRVQGRTKSDEQRLLRDAKALEKIGVFAIVLEGIPASLGKKITRALRIPTIGIGAGVDCDGQILVLDDVLGLSAPPRPKFVKAYADLRVAALKGLRRYASDVRSKRFPSVDESYS
jgi:3-methyl-2-oxobutanoate hydroxymethyltransferase